MARVRRDNDARYALRASFVDDNGDVITGDTITIGNDSRISDTDISNWNTAYGWGDHSTQGYYSGDIRLDCYPGRLGESSNDWPLEVYQPTANTDAMMSFHVSGDYAVQFGLDGSTNKLSVGGWSMGANMYEIYHSGNPQTNITGNAATSTRVEYRDGRTDATSYPVLWGADASGYTYAFSCAAVKIQSSTGTLFATTFSGALNGNATTATSVNGITSPLSTDTSQNITNHKEFQDNIELRFGNGADVRMDWNGTDFYCRSYSHGGRLLFQGEDSSGTNRALVYMDPDGETGIYYAGAKKGYTYSSGFRVTGNLLATSNVYAYYSDKRLKDVKGQITDALDKVDAIETFYYTHNDTARDLGYEGEEMQVGVAAQSVQAVMPEVVHRAPIDDDGEGGSVTGEDYVTVDYPRLVPLLIEAIKELKAKVEELENASNNRASD